MKRNSRHIIYIILTLLICVLLSYYVINNLNNKTTTINGTYFDTLIQIKINDKCSETTKQQCLDLLSKYDKLLDPNDKNSDIYKINYSNSNEVTVSKETVDIIDTAINYSKKYNSFNPCMYTINNFWKTTTNLNDMSTVTNSLKHIDYNNIVIDKKLNTVLITDNETKLDLGGIAKGYISDKLKNFLISKNIKNALINLGGNITTIGLNENNTPYKIGIKSPDNNSDSIITIKSYDTSIVTSGQYERQRIIGGKTYGHIIDPKNGLPVDNDILQISIICNNSTKADVLSTAMFVVSINNALKMINNEKDTSCIIVDKNNKIYYSDNFDKSLLIK